MLQRGYGHGPGMSGLLWFGGLWVLLLIAVLAVLGWLLLRSRGVTPGRGSRWHAADLPGQVTSRPAGPPAGQPVATALDVLQLRLARGEIDLDTYRTLRDELTQPGVPEPVTSPAAD